MDPLSPTRRIFVPPSPSEARKKMMNFIAGSFVGFPNWYLGTSSNPEDRLFVHHKVEKESFWIYKDAGSEEAARTIVKFIMDTYQTKGNADSGDGNARYVYAYVMTDMTDNSP
jgi:hypothetical protein